mgnify:CR=1 FL=1
MITNTARLDSILAKHTAISTFADLLATSPSYIPTLDVREFPDLREVADALVANGRDAYVRAPEGTFFARDRFNATFQAPEVRKTFSKGERTLVGLRSRLGTFSSVSCSDATRKAIQNAVSATRTAFDAQGGSLPGGRVLYTLTGPKGGTTQVYVRPLSERTTKRTGKTLRIEG